MPSFWRVVKEVIKNSDVLLLVMDARFPRETYNDEILEKIEWKKKPVIFVLNKSELVTKKFEEIALPKGLKPVVWFSAQKHYGVNRLRDLILKLGKERPVTVGILGFPNTGKSSLINCMSQRHAAKTSSKSGLTRGMQKVKVSKDIYFIDTPGVFPYKERDEEAHALMGALDASKVKDPDVVAMRILQKFYESESEGIEKLYKVKLSGDVVEDLDEVAFKMNWLKKGGKPDIMKASRRIIEDWQKGNLKL